MKTLIKKKNVRLDGIEPTKTSGIINNIVDTMRWRPFLSDNMISLPKSDKGKMLNSLNTSIQANREEIKHHWSKNPNMHLGEVLIALKLVNHDPILIKTDEVKWLKKIRFIKE